MKMELDQPAVSAHHFFMTRYKIPQLQCGDEFYARNTYFDAYLLMSQLTKFERASCKLQNDTCTTKAEFTWSTYRSVSTLWMTHP